MPKAEVGSTKYLNNKLKSKGLQRLRWYCQVCEKQNRDENGFKCHVQSESHVRRIQAIGAEGSQRVISDYSKDFQRDFLQLLRTSHNTKPVHINHFYQQYIGDKEHVHMNATRWPSLTEFAKHLGREGICRVEDNDKGLHIAWIDTSPDALRRQEAIRKKERQDKGDEEREQKLIMDQIRKAEMDAAKDAPKENDENQTQLKREDGEKIKLSFTARAHETARRSPPLTHESEQNREEDGEVIQQAPVTISTSAMEDTSKTGTVSLKPPTTQKPKNVFANPFKKNAVGPRNPLKAVAKKPVSEAERIMKEEIERKRTRSVDTRQDPTQKRPRLG